MQLSVNADVMKRDSVSPKSAPPPPPPPTPLKTDKPQKKRRSYIPETEPHIEAKVNTFRSQQKEGDSVFLLIIDYYKQDYVDKKHSFPKILLKLIVFLDNVAKPMNFHLVHYT